MMSMRIYVMAVALTASMALPSAQAPLPEVERFGPRVGETVPDFSLVDHRGEARTLQSLMGRNGMMLVFSRSADW